ncbi:MAG: hypothetical protein JNL01_04060 [Bdellovibrionales bacterium]|nr:hypothetical protein [Bdellovibrionales bacterium]
MASQAAPQRDDEGEFEGGYPQRLFTFGEGQLNWKLQDAAGKLIENQKATLDYQQSTMVFQAAIWLGIVPLAVDQSLNLELFLPFSPKAYELIGDTYLWKSFAGGSDLSTGKMQTSLSKTSDPDGRLHFQIQVSASEILDPTSPDPKSFEIVIYDQTFLPFVSLRFYR